ncbi:MAG TPA: glycosyltransferase [Planctomycetota bacterium]
MRVLLIAEAANPEWTSVPLVGWCQAKAIANSVDTHLVTQVRNREAILRAGYREPQDFTAIDSERVAAGVYRFATFLRGGSDRGWTTVTALESLSYRYFERLVWRQFEARLRAGEFDLVHRLTPLSPSMSSYIVGGLQRLGVPFVLGPLNGGLPWPRGFGARRWQEGEWLSYLRGAHRLLPSHRATRNGAAAILIGSRITWQEMPARHHAKCVYMPENGIDRARIDPAREPLHLPPLRVVFVGRLVPCKGVDMLIDAAAPLVRDGSVVVEIIGDGPLRGDLERQARELHIAAGVTFTGWVEHALLQNRLRGAHAFAFPSIRDFGGAVVLEAMASGLVPVVVDYGGPPESAAGDAGLRVPLGSREEIVAGFRTHFAELAASPQKLAQFAERARARAMLFTWDHKAACLREVYRWVLGQRDKPDFGQPFAPKESVLSAS